MVGMGGIEKYPDTCDQGLKRHRIISEGNLDQYHKSGGSGKSHLRIIDSNTAEGLKYEDPNVCNTLGG